MKFDFEQGFDRYWHSASPFKSLFWTQLSTAFAPGERFFIDSARALKSKVDDPALLEEIAEFCKQEGHHTAQHLKFDQLNAAMGIDIEGCRKRYARILDSARNGLDPMEMLAATCALEHFTSAFADAFFKEPQIADGADPKVVALWAWHAAEEAEHRATCFDIYQQLGGRYLRRVSLMLGSWFLILWAALTNTMILLWKDRSLFTRDTWRGLFYLFGRRGVITSLVPAFFRYLRPSFHPWQEGDPATIARWQEHNARYIVNLDEVLDAQASRTRPEPARLSAAPRHAGIESRT
jgi:predicted metal-dependent hydrolase